MKDKPNQASPSNSKTRRSSPVKSASAKLRSELFPQVVFPDNETATEAATRRTVFAVLVRNRDSMTVDTIRDLLSMENKKVQIEDIQAVLVKISATRCPPVKCESGRWSVSETYESWLTTFGGTVTFQFESEFRGVKNTALRLNLEQFRHLELNAIAAGMKIEEYAKALAR